MSSSVCPQPLLPHVRLHCGLMQALCASVPQGIFHSKWNVQVKRLAYDLCKAVPISDENINLHVLPGIKVSWECARTACIPCTAVLEQCTLFLVRHYFSYMAVSPCPGSLSVKNTEALSFCLASQRSRASTRPAVKADSVDET